MAEGSKVAGVERRRRPRVPFGLPAHYFLANGREYRGKVTDASSAGLVLLGEERGLIGDRVIVEVDGIAKLEGRIVRHLAGGFAVRFSDGQSEAAKAIAVLVERRLSDIG
jgi:hypothetical protein